LELDGAEAGGEGFGFEAIGVALAGFGAFVGLGLEGLAAFLAHGFIDEQADAFGEAAGAFSLRSCRTVFKSSGLLWWVILVFSWMCLLTPQQETSLARPRPVFRARSASTPPGFGCARLATLAFAPPHPGGVEAQGRKTIYRNRFTPQY
jgi:hypothetical protein